MENSSYLASGVIIQLPSTSFRQPKTKSPLKKFEYLSETSESQSNDINGWNRSGIDCLSSCDKNEMCKQ